MTAAEWSEGAAGPVLRRLTPRDGYWRPVQASADAIAAAAGPEGRERDWRDDALCSQADPERWFPEFGENGYTLAAVKAVCRKCPVRPECLEFILAPGNDDICGYGIWAGTTERERRRLKRAAA